MTTRKIRIMSLMAKQEQRQIGQLASQLEDLRSREMQQFDMIDRLNNILEQAGAAPPEAMTPGQLRTWHFIGNTLVQQLEEVRGQMVEIQSRRRQVEADLSQHHQRGRILNDRIDQTRRESAAMAAQG
jgi:chromosome segregation ATPase